MAEQEFTTEELESEEWRDIDGFGGTYWVSSLGRVLSNKLREPRILRTALYVQYPAVCLFVKGKEQYVKRVHSLVAAAFHGVRPDGYEVNHIDGDKTNNRASNLEYVTHQQNINHAVKSGLYPKGVRRGPSKRRGERAWNAKLRDTDIPKIRAKLAAGIKGAVIGREYGVSNITISMIKTGRSWTHI